jgi:uncharacterized membrane protein
VSTFEWLLFLHVLSAFVLISSLVLFSFLIAFLWKRDLPSDIARVTGISRLGTVLIGIGSIGVLVFGIALAFEADSYAIWDGWIVAALVLWAVMGELGRRTGIAYDATGARARDLVAQGQVGPNRELGAMFRSQKALGLHVATVVAALVLLLDMIFKPGA